MKKNILFWITLMVTMFSPLSSFAAENSTTISKVNQSETQTIPDNFSSEVGAVHCTGEGENAICIET